MNTRVHQIFWRAEFSKIYLVPFKRKSIFRKLKINSVSLVIRNQLETGIILLVRTCSRIDYSLRRDMLARLTIHLAYGPGKVCQEFEVNLSLAYFFRATAYVESIDSYVDDTGH